MEIQNLSTKYMVRKLNNADIEKVYEVMQGNPLFFQYCPPMATEQSIADDMRALPPRTTEDDKYYVGYFEGETLVAVIDLIFNFPNQETAFIGFFMMNREYQGKGLGTEIMEACYELLVAEGYRYVRLGFAKGNPQSEHFWTKNGFVRTGVEDVQARYTVVVMEKQLKTPPTYDKITLN